jgi:transcriptional regulator with XRE-family HTH domain
MGIPNNPSYYQNSNEYVVNGARLSKARLAAQMSLEDVARALSCNKSQVSRWEQQKLTPSPKRIELLAELFRTRNFIVKNERVEGK